MSTAEAKMTQEIMAAWDEVRDPDEPEPVDESAGTADPVDTEDEERAEDEAVPAEEEEAEEEAPDEEGEEGEDAEEPSEEEQAEEPPGETEGEAVTFDSDDPGVQAFLARYESTEEALKAAARIEHAFGRQGRELGQTRERVAQLEAQLEQATLFANQGTGFLSDEARAWVEEAVESGDAPAYIQNAVGAGEFDLARAVLEASDLTAPQAIRFAQAIDRAEQLAYTQAQPEQQPLAHNVLMEVLVEHFPDMPQYEADMVATLRALGEGHPLVVLAQSEDPGQAAQGIVGVYEIARAKSATVVSTRESVKKKTRQAAAAAKDGAVVSSGSATPPQAQVPRQRPIMPGLTLEALEAEFATE